MPRITKTLVDRTRPADKDCFVWDTEIMGFGLKVHPSGLKSYVFQYRTPEGRTRRMTLGKHSHTMTADQARTKAKKMRRAVEDGRDPLGEKQAARNALTVSDLLTEYLNSEKFASKAETTQANDRGRIRRHLIPTMGNKFVDKLTAEDVRRAFASIRDGKTAADVKTRQRGRAIVKGGEGAARMAIRVFRAIMSWAVSEGLVASNPATGIKVGSDGTREAILETPDQYATLFRTLEEMEADYRIRPAAADAIRVIALTGARRGEVAGLRWAHVDLQKGVIQLPWKAHKSGRATGKPRIIGLPAAAQAIIAKQPEGSADDFVFTPAKGEGAISLSKPWREVREEAGLPADVTLHSLRHSLASAMAMSGAQAAEIMAALGHRQLSTSARYIHWAQDARAALAERAAAHITVALNHSTKAEPIPLKRQERESRK